MVMKRFHLRSIALAFTAATAVASVLYVLPLFADVPTAVPSIFFYVKDSGGANNGPGQKDLTLMGWYEDKGDPGIATDDVLDMIWNWDEITVSGNNTLDACALFDSELPQGDGFINVAICGTVLKVNGPNGGMFLKGTPSVYTCSNSKQDRCTNPTLQAAPSAANLQGGALVVNASGVPQAIPANPYDLVTSTDPFNPLGDGSPKDTTLRLRIARTWLNGLTPGGLPRLTNVCSYPSQEPNSDPSDCNNPPGGGFLKIVKDAIPDSTLDFGFQVVSSPSGAGVNNCPSTTPCDFDVREGTPAQLSILIGLADVTEDTVVQNWSLTGAVCTFDGAGSAGGTFDGTSQYSGAQISSGVITVCTFTNTRDTGSITVRKVLDPTNDGGRFTLAIKSGATTLDSLSNAGHNSFLTKSVNTGTGYSLTETADAGTTLANYDSTWTCTDGSSGNGTTISSLTVAKGGTIDCTFTNKLKQGTLIVRKVVDNTANPAATPPNASAFSFKDNGGSTVVFPAEGPNDGDADSNPNTATVILTVAPGSTHSIVENAVTGYTASYAAVPGSNSCTNLTVAGGATVTCTITNTFDKASPGRGTQQNWVIHDKLTLTGLQVNAGTAKVHFRLYSNATCTTLVGSNNDRPITGSGSSWESVTGNGVAVSTPGTYYWQVEYTGNQYWNAFTTNCSDAADRESTQIIADDSVN
jgi:hypothetical protein